MRILAIDPSSTKTGYAVFDEGKMFEAGLFVPSKSGLSVVQRVSDMVDDFSHMLANFDCFVHDNIIVVIEMPLGKQCTRTPGKKSGFAVWAGAAWAFWATARTICRTYPVSNTVWTRGKSKADRQLAASIIYKSYDKAADKGGDISDAIMLGDWWLHQQTIAKAKMIGRYRTVGLPAAGQGGLDRPAGEHVGCPQAGNFDRNAGILEDR